MRFLSLISLASLGFISFLSSSLMAQEVASPQAGSESESLQVVDEASTNSMVPNASPEPVPPASSFSTNNEEINVALPSTEEPSTSVVPTDPSMVPSAESESGAVQPFPMDPNAVNSSNGENSEEDMETPAVSTESIEKKKHELKIRYTAIRTRVEKDAAVAALQLKADKATTEEGKRQALRAYYELLFKKMKQIDPSLSERCDTMQGAYLRRLEQVKLEPTIPLHQAPVIEEVPSASPTPQPTSVATKGKGNKKKQKHLIKTPSSSSQDLSLPNDSAQEKR